jgi:hypothetical protein
LVDLPNEASIRAMLTSPYEEGFSRAGRRRMKPVAGGRTDIRGEREQISPNVEKQLPNGSRQARNGAAFLTPMATIRFEPIHTEAFEQQLMGRKWRSERVRAVLWVTLIFWVTNYVFLTLATELTRRGHLAQLIPVRFGEMVLGLGFCFAIHLLLRRLPTARKRLLVLAFAAPTAAIIFASLAFLGDATVYPDVRIGEVTWGVAVMTVLPWTWLFLAWAGAYLTVSSSFDVREEQERTAELRERAHVAQLRALHSQINPHFLFNSLNSVSALILDRQIDQADEMVTKLAQFLRLGLSADPTHKIPLSTEVQLQRTFLEIEQLRYPDLQIAIDVDSRLLEAKVPALILQPIVENAVKFGIDHNCSPATIGLTASQRGARLVLEVVNSSSREASTRQGAGIGLANVRQRLNLIYGDHRAELVARPRTDSSYGVEIALPLELP